MIINPKTISWVNATQGINQSGATVAWDPTTDLAAVEISFDGVAAVTVPVALGATSFNLTTLPAYTALPSGSHTIGLAEVTKEGAVSAFAASVTFLVSVVPLAPTSVVVA